MKKKELISKIDSLINSLNNLNAELQACRAENTELKARIEELSIATTEKEPETATEIETETEPETEIQAEEDIEDTEDFKEAPTETKEQEEETVIPEIEEELPDKKVLNILPIGENVVLPDSIMEFGAEIIGKIVIESAKYADLVAASTTLNKKELLNLIMGKSEVCKAEILNVVTSNASTETKISLINSQLSEAVDYFKSVAAQI